MNLRLLTLLALVAGGCGEKDDSAPPTTDDSAVQDADGDGYVDDDCDDGDAAVNPGAAELPYDGVDNDCDEATPDDDLDGDGALNAQDCDDNDPLVSPSATEGCDGIDEDCDGLIDEGATSTWFTDGDGDGFGGDESAVEACEAPSGAVSVGGDCDDGDAAFNPSAVEDDCTDPNDYNCDGSTGAVDADGDGFYACEECRDLDASAYPGAPETCDEVDDDCDGQVDEGVELSFYRDRDGDGYGDASQRFEGCEAISGYADNADDCDDSDSGVNPGAADDYPDGVDDDCDGRADDDVPSYSHAADVQPLWDRYCTGCHVNYRQEPSGGLDLTDGYSALVGVASTDVRSMDFVNPSDTATSYLWRKLTNTQASAGGSGDPMPPARSTQLSAAELQVIEVWILTGAAR